MSDRSWDRFSGLLIGAALGFVAGILLAPESGENTRESLRRRTQDSIDQLRDGAGDLRQTISQRGHGLLSGSVTEIEIREQVPVDDAESSEQ